LDALNVATEAIENWKLVPNGGGITEWVGGGTLQERIIDNLVKPRTGKDLAQILGERHERVGQCLGVLSRQGLIRRADFGCWQVV
jgi:hypothetical protein